MNVNKRGNSLLTLEETYDSLLALVYNFYALLAITSVKWYEKDMFTPAGRKTLLLEPMKR
jgi:hypothetical protein